MIIDRRAAARLLIGAGGTFALPIGVQRAFAKDSEGIVRSHGASLVGELKYPADFPHFEYVNPDAPKGGRVRIDAVGTFDSFNPFIVKDNPASSLGLIYDTLMMSSFDQPSTEYGLVAEWIEHPKDYSWVAFRLRDEARWNDGRPITPEDVVFSFNILTTEGHPFYAQYYANVVGVKDMGDRVVRFEFDQKDNRELPQIVGQLAVLPKHFWDGREFERLRLDVPLGSGAYRIGDFAAGSFVEYERVEDYWAKDLPANIGYNNFDRIRIEYFKDRQAAFEGFKAGKFDFWNENSSKRWAVDYEFPALKKGDVVQQTPALDGPKVAQSFAFNLRREKFADRRTRMALNMAFDFEWTNKAIFFDQYARPLSYFQGTSDLMSSGVPEGAELELLEPFRSDLPPELFDAPFENPVSDGSGRPDRRRLRTAKKLLQDAGWKVDGGKLVDDDGNPFTFEFLIGSSLQERVISPFIKNLERLGIDARIRLVDAAQYASRYEAYDFDMVVGRVSNSSSPGNEQREFWGSEAAEFKGARNINGVKDPVIDALIDKIIFADDREALAAACRALDRVLLWGYYNILQLYTPYERIAVWKDRIAGPDPLPSHSVGFPSVWWSKETEG